VPYQQSPRNREPNHANRYTDELTIREYPKRGKIPHARTYGKNSAVERFTRTGAIMDVNTHQPWR
jgi:hypothetical protein